MDALDYNMTEINNQTKRLTKKENSKKLYNELYFKINDFFVIYNNIDLAYNHAIIEKSKIIKANYKTEIEQASKLYDKILETIKNEKINQVEAKKQIDYLTNYKGAKAKSIIKKIIFFIFNIFKDGFITLIVIILALLGMSGKKK